MEVIKHLQFINHSYYLDKHMFQHTLADKDFNIVILMYTCIHF